MKKVLLITYYWPPAGGTGTQRCLKFARHLPACGWQPVIFTHAHRASVSADESLSAALPGLPETYSVKAWEPYSLYRLFTGKTKEQAATPHLSTDTQPGWRDRFSKWVRDNYFIPDARRFWIRPSVKFLTEYLAKNNVGAIFTSGPPHSAHLIGLQLKKKFPQVRWVADFRDPWMHIDSYHHSAISSSAAEKQKALERGVLRNADAVITVSDSICSSLASEVNSPSGKFHTITNSFDASFFVPVKKQDDRFVITHAGTLYNNRNPSVLWKVLAELVNENAEFRRRFRLRLIGKTEAKVLDSLAANGLRDFLEQPGLVTHREALQGMSSSDLLLVLVNEVPEAQGIITGKFFEYLGAQKPVLAIGPVNGDLAAIMRETNCGFIAEHADAVMMRRAILSVFSESYSPGFTGTGKYSAEETTRRLAAILEGAR